MTDAYSLKQAFSCSDFLNELWQNGADSGDSLVGLPAPSEGGSAQLAREKSADMLDLLGGPEETQSNTNAFGAIASSSSNQQGLPGKVCANLCTDSATRQNTSNTALSGSSTLITDLYAPCTSKASCSKIHTSLQVASA